MPGCAITLIQRHLQVVMALAAREIKTRYSSDIFGFGWALLTPAAWIGLLLIAFDLFGRVLPIHADAISFILSGVMPYLLFRSSISAISRTRSQYRTLMFLGVVTRAHIGVALSLIELISSFILYVLLMGINWGVTGHLHLFAPFHVFGALFLAWLFGFSLGSLLDELSRVYLIFSRLVPVVLRPFFMISGVFFSANEVPLSMLAYLVWNPLLHAIELLREGMFSSYHSQVVDVPYLVASTLLLFVLAILMRLQVRGGHE